jgi:hypothetical protein
MLYDFSYVSGNEAKSGGDLLLIAPMRRGFLEERIHIQLVEKSPVSSFYFTAVILLR